MGRGGAGHTNAVLFWWRRRAGQAAVPGRAELLASLDCLINLNGKPWIFSLLSFVLMIVLLLVLHFVLMIVLLLVLNFVLSCFDILVLNFVPLIVLLFN